MDVRAPSPRIIVHSRLILWNGSAEVALSATDERTHTIIWTTFAAGPPELLARHLEARIGGLSTHLPAR